MDSGKPSNTGEDLFIITTEYDKFDKTRERLDILCLGKNGKVVVVELKRDESLPYPNSQSRFQRQHLNQYRCSAHPQGEMADSHGHESGDPFKHYTAISQSPIDVPGI
jgi:hypothetical protein